MLFLSTNRQCQITEGCSGFRLIRYRVESTSNRSCNRSDEAQDLRSVGRAWVYSGPPRFGASTLGNSFTHMCVRQPAAVVKVRGYGVSAPPALV